jgi:circadian clock protein KaiB
MTSSKPQENRRATVRMILFVAGEEANSRRAKENLSRLCEEEMQDGYELDVVDVLENFKAALENHVMVTPTLIVTDPPPGVTILGDLRDTGRLRAALGLDRVLVEK